MIGPLILWLLFWIAGLAMLAFVLRLAWRAVRTLERRETGRAELAAMERRLARLENTVGTQARELQRLRDGDDVNSAISS